MTDAPASTIYRIDGQPADSSWMSRRETGESYGVRYLALLLSTRSPPTRERDPAAGGGCGKERYNWPGPAVPGPIAGRCSIGPPWNRLGPRPCRDRRSFSAQPLTHAREIERF